jgi:hypothetical protein
VPASTPAVVAGWAVRALDSKTYPGLVPAPGVAAEGLVLQGLTSEEWQVLDAFESPMYSLQLVLPAGQPEAWAYVAPEGVTLDRAWSPTRFATNDLPSYLLSCTRWRREHEVAAAMEGSP